MATTLHALACPGAEVAGGPGRAQLSNFTLAEPSAQQASLLRKVRGAAPAELPRARAAAGRLSVRRSILHPLSPPARCLRHITCLVAQARVREDAYRTAADIIDKMAQRPSLLAVWEQSCPGLLRLFEIARDRARS